MKLSCVEDHQFDLASTKDHLILPVGSVGETLVTVYRGAVEVTIGGNEAEEPITDVDLYGSALVPP